MEPSVTAATASNPSQTSHRAATLAVLSVAQFLIALDYSIIYVALPSIARDLQLEAALAQWIVSAYAVLFAGFLIVGGRLVDRLGARRLFIVAILAFGLASVIGGAATGGTVLLVARGAQGLGAALLQPAVLGLIGERFPAGQSRNKALAVWGSVGAAGLAAGAVLGGVLTTASWRLTFFINVPITLLCAVGAAVWVATSAGREGNSQVPIVASTLGTATVLGLVLGLTLSAGHGWSSAPTLICLGLAAVLFAGFVGTESRSRNVLIEHVLRRTPSLRVGAAAAALYMASVGSEFYLLTLLLQALKGYRPLQAGLAFLPLALMVTAGSATAGRAVRWVRSTTVLIGGFIVATVGLLWLSLTLQRDSYAMDLLPALVLSGFGHGLIFTSMFIIGTRDVPPAHQGTAGALLTTSQYVAGALIVAILTVTLGPSAGYPQFRAAFLVTTVAAALGVVLVAAGRERLEAGRVAELGRPVACPGDAS